MNIVSSDFKVISYLDYASEILLGGQVSEGDEALADGE